MKFFSKVALVVVTYSLMFVFSVQAEVDELSEYFRKRQLELGSSETFKEVRQSQEQDKPEEGPAKPKPQPEKQIDLEVEQLARFEIYLYAKTRQEIVIGKARAKELRQERLAELGPGASAEAKAQIKAEYNQTVALLELDLEYIKEQRDREDFTPDTEADGQFDAIELQIEGNDTISADELLEDMPVVFDLKDPYTGKTVDVYDFYTIRKMLIKPLQADAEQSYKLSKKNIQGLTKYILGVYTDRGYSGIYVYIPAEVIPKKDPVLKDRILKVNVLEARISDINVNYKRYDPNAPGSLKYRDIDPQKAYLLESVIREWSPAKEGELASEAALSKFCNLLNLNPDRYVIPIISRGTSSESLALDFDVYEKSPWHLYVQTDNSGSKERRWNPTIGLINTNVTGRDDKLTAIYQGPLQSQPLKPVDENYSVYGSYEFPVLSPRLRMTLFGGHSNFNIDNDIPGGSVNFLGSGDFAGAILRFNLFQVNMQGSQDPWFFDVTGSLRREKSRVSPSIGVESDLWWDLWSMGAGFYRNERSGKEASTSFAFDRFSSYDASSKESFEVRPGSVPDFSIYTASAVHSQYLDADKVHRIDTAFRWIYPDERLASAKMTSFGGLYSVRGYEEDEIVADGGILFRAEYEFDLISYFNPQRADQGDSQSRAPEAEQSWLRRLAVVTFADIGRAEFKKPMAGEDRIVELGSFGWGLKAEIMDDLSVGAYYGIPLRATERTDTGKGRAYLGLVYHLQF